MLDKLQKIGYNVYVRSQCNGFGRPKSHGKRRSLACAFGRILPVRGNCQRPKAQVRERFFVLPGSRSGDESQEIEEFWQEVVVEGAENVGCCYSFFYFQGIGAQSEDLCCHVIQGI